MELDTLYLHLKFFSRHYLSSKRKMENRTLQQPHETLYQLRSQ